ncbi:MAG: flavin reductase family protein [Pseudomonadota bacterium]|nr:flavin reductase family protein [Pseudomonadota bacterium]
MFYETRSNNHGLPHDPFKAIIAPRPIGWISTVNAEGGVNLAPYSFFTAIADDPYYVMFASGGRKDSQRNAEETGEFVCSLATWDLREQMNRTSAPVPPDVDEMKLAGLTPAPSRLVRPPRVGESPVALECTYFRTIDLPGRNGSAAYSMVIGEVVGIHIDDAAIINGKVDTASLKPIARLGYRDYAVVERAFSITRPR